MSFSTLPELLLERSQSSSAHIGFLDANGGVAKTVTYTDLYKDTVSYAARLVGAGIRRDTTPAVLSSFLDQESHLRLFWACAFVGVPFCPLPEAHPDPERQKILLEHLRSLFSHPVLIGDAQATAAAAKLAPGLNVLDVETISRFASTPSNEAFPARKPSGEEPVAFMLTSGSTGNSKAVVLRHRNFLSSSNGKSVHHNTSASSVFFNWIAIDHVASLSEVHIHALLAGASQYHAAPSAIVHNPWRLLEWTDRLKISYTFSPNFLLAAILKDTATAASSKLDLSSLRALISGGESVPIKTAVAFADLLERFGASRDVLRAGFGMSETAAGSIYDRAPIPKSAEGDLQYLSLGTCAPGISMRIVGADGRPAGPLEAGQLQITGTTVFDHYYNNAAATSSAFTDDGWFITGDLGVIDNEGRLHLVGRDKDCINSNGVKIPTADVENYIAEAKIEGLGDVYVVPVRLQDAQTETYTVFYPHSIAVNADISDNDRATLITLNRQIRDLASLFCSQSPHTVLPLPKEQFVKTAIGKVSRARLAQTYLKGTFSEIEEALRPSLLAQPTESDLSTPIELAVADSIRLVFNMDDMVVTRATNVFDVGASSMHLMRLKQVIQERLGLAELATIEMLKRPVVGPLCEFLTQAKANADSGEIPEYNPVVVFNSAGSKPPVFLVHPGVGEVLVFINLARVLADDRPVYAIRAKGFDHGDKTFDTLEETVVAYADAIEAKYPSGPYNVAGYSYGGAIAFEIGKLLEKRGRKVNWLGILNLPPHIQFRLKELSWTEVLLNICMFLSLIPGTELDKYRDMIRGAFPEVAGSDLEPAEPIPPITWMFERVDKKRLAELDLELGAFVRWVKVAYEINRTGRIFVPEGKVAGALTSVFCAIPLPSMGTREQFKANRLSHWQEFANAFEMIDVDGEHYTMLSEHHVESFAAHMRGSLKRSEELAEARDALISSATH